MHFLACLAAFLVASATSIHAECYNSGETWTSYLAEHDIQEAVQAFAAGGKTWPPKVEQKHTAWHSTGCVKFILQNISPFPRTIYEAEAYDGFSKEHTGCTHGGDSSYTNWRFVADPESEAYC
ncbi:hypothetical protein DFH06DRAFT_1331801 [Mycena polygramma]|nr:hypothetical protein DFH06DRAFT_1331801 [Mycena polygramma]